MLVVAGWLVVRAGATPFQVVVMLAGYALLELALVVLAVPILLAEAAFLLSLALPALPGARVPAQAPLATP